MSPAPPGERHSQAKMTDRKVEELRDWYAEGGISIVEIANEFGISPNTAGNIIRHETWKHVRAARVRPCPTCNGKGRVSA